MQPINPRRYSVRHGVKTTALDGSLCNKRQRGVTFVEVLVAACILTTSLAAIISLWSFSYNMTMSTNDQVIGYNLARQTLEWIQATGFYNTVEAPASAPIVHYFDSSSTNRDSQTSQARYKVTTTVISDHTVAGSNPVQPATNALRAVTVTVTLVATGQQLYQTATYLARGGI